MSDRFRWAERASQLQFEQLEVARKQAEGWRTGLAGITTLLGVVLVVKGRDSVADLAPPFPWVVVALLAGALATLISATLLALRAASGSPSNRLLLTGEDLRRWTREEVIRVETCIGRARLATLAGVAMVALAVGFSWLSPVGKDHLVIVEYGAIRLCGTLTTTEPGSIAVTTGVETRVIALTSITRLSPAASCKPDNTPGDALSEVPAR